MPSITKIVFVVWICTWKRRNNEKWRQVVGGTGQPLWFSCSRWDTLSFCVLICYFEEFCQSACTYLFLLHSKLKKFLEFTGIIERNCCMREEMYIDILRQFRNAIRRIWALRPTIHIHDKNIKARTHKFAVKCLGSRVPLCPLLWE